MRCVKAIFHDFLRLQKDPFPRLVSVLLCVIVATVADIPSSFSRRLAPFEAIPCHACALPPSPCTTQSPHCLTNSAKILCVMVGFQLPQPSSCWSHMALLYSFVNSPVGRSALSSSACSVTTLGPGSTISGAR
jgi:hypothetical protein